MQTLIGSATAFSSGGPGKGMYARAVTNLMQQHAFVDSASSFNSHFSDSGLFGLEIQGPGSHSAELYSVLLEEFSRLRDPIHEQELNRAKNILKMNILMSLERSDDRLEEIARNYNTFGEFTFQHYCEKIDAVTSD
jgi:processing peptidase subunit alpha